ncbi:GNAT family N-acetyltransferase [Lentilactobacillus sp. Marseille-Q4993]|uniref:GNAT family N-acetyltransferase n=1 Tax=Lentilactobacillus sp. Marseille-Q4993 TaxID=3039492 RepID=UPI0024BD0453|nr:GNAT family N-acetyltransferase [Lentilactobacillus sp. Marseille-Q4993]
MPTIYVRKATPNDIPAIMSIINQAKALLKADGSPQWQDGHPNLEMITEDIEAERNWLLIVDGKVAGTAVLLTTPDPNYRVIKNGSWANDDEKYAAIHRIAVSADYRGHHLAKFFISNLLTVANGMNIHNIRIDTHKLNIRMQNLVTTCGFNQQGIIYVDDKNDPERLAYELNFGKE